MTETTTSTTEQQQPAGTAGQGAGTGSAGGQQQPAETGTTTSTETSGQQTDTTGQGGQQQDTGTGQQNGQQGKTFTQAELDSILQRRLKAAEGEWAKKVAAALGGEDSTTDPAKLLDEAKQNATTAQGRADKAEAKALALAAGIKSERVDRFVQLVDLAGALQGVDRSDDAAVSKAIQSAVDSAVADVPEFKGTSLPNSSGTDRGNTGSGKPTYTKAQIEAMSSDELAEKASELTAAMAEGRIH